jgi:hypothetical protein
MRCGRRWLGQVPDAIGGQDVVRMAVQVLTGSQRIVVRGSACRAAICTSRKSMPASKLVVTKRMAEHVRMCPCDLDAGGFGEVPQAAGSLRRRM